MIVKLKIYFVSNNIFIVACNTENKLFFLVTSGQLLPKIRGKRKISIIAVDDSIKVVIKKLIHLKCKFISIFFYGRVRYRKLFLKSFNLTSIRVIRITENISVAFGGCRLPHKPRK